MKFQTVDAFACDRDPRDLTSRYSSIDQKRCIVTLFGRCVDGSSVACHVQFRPFLYVQVPDHLDARKFVSALSNEIGAAADVQYTEHRMYHLYGFEPTSAEDPSVRKWRHLKLTFSNTQCMKNATKRLAQVSKWAMWAAHPELQCWQKEAQMPVVHKFCDSRDVQIGGWVQFDDACARSLQKRICTCTHEVFVDAEVSIRPLDASDPLAQSMAPLVVASVDGEMFSAKGEFPFADNAGDYVGHIGITKWTLGRNDSFQRYIIGIGNSLPVCSFDVDADRTKTDSNTVTVNVDSERELFCAFQKTLVGDIDPDFVVGYNICGFDWQYFSTRATSTGASSFFFLSRFATLQTPVEEHVYSSKARGEIVSHHFQMPGRVEMDVLDEVRKNYKLRSYKLGEVSLQFLKDDKHDLPPAEIHKCYADATPESLHRIGSYCLKDTDLVARLLQMFNWVTDVIQMACCVLITPSEVIRRGSQHRVFSSFALFAHRNGYVVNDVHPDMNRPLAPGDKYTGAIVMEPMIGYHRRPTATLDYKSLYPSEIIENNLCTSTWIHSDGHARQLPESAINHIVVDDESGRSHSFVRHVEGVLPKWCRAQLRERDVVKSAMNKETDPDKKALLNSKQLARKLVANSGYGFFGVNPDQAMYPCRAVAESTTATGRKTIQECKRFVETPRPEHGRARVAYGDTDSVMVQFDDCVDGSHESIARAAAYGKWLSRAVTQKWGPVLVLEFECIKCPFRLLKPKRYASVEYAVGKDGTSLTCKGIVPHGIETVRRDNAPLTSHMMDEALTALMLGSGGEDDAHEIVRSWLDRLCSDNALDWSEFVMSKGLRQRSAYANPDSQVQVVVAERIAQRTPGAEPKAGSRVQFVVVHAPGVKRGDPLFKRVEDADYAREHGLKLDLQWYLESSATPILSFFSGMDVEPRLRRLYADAKIRIRNQTLGVRPITEFIRVSSMMNSDDDANDNDNDDDGDSSGGGGGGAAAKKKKVLKIDVAKGPSSSSWKQTSLFSSLCKRDSDDDDDDV